MHPTDELGRRGAGADGGPGDSGGPPGVNVRTRGAVLFALGFLLGALAFYYLLWRTGGLTPGHFVSRTTADLIGATRATTPAPLATIPFPLTPEGISAGSSTPTPEPGLGDETTPGGSFLPDRSRTPRPLTLSGTLLEGRALQMPVAGARTIDLRDNFREPRGSRLHQAIDILAPRGTPVVAADEGRIAKLHRSKQGGLTVYQFDRDETHAYYYAHLDRYSEGLKEGSYLRRGDSVGQVGTTGNAPPDTPHLHFAIFELGPEKRWWEGKPVNPYPFLMKAQIRSSGSRPQ